MPTRQSLFVTLIAVYQLTPLFAKADFLRGSFQCFNDSHPAFSFGPYGIKNGYGQQTSVVDRTDFDMFFADKLEKSGFFAPRGDGPNYENYRNNFYPDNGHRTLLVGGGLQHSGPLFLYVLKPQNNLVTLEIWQWNRDTSHYGHEVLNGDSLVFKKTFFCNKKN